MTAEQLLSHIEDYRAKMIKLAGRSSMVDHKVVEVSNKLDGLLMQYFHMTQKQ
ncbi:aspartyl-phosphate phosphatase Spo0E family protein [Bacillus massiliglaciei]|uniref:aspartyl-phosphate phosphatase Spo0E family protein n=1 Tax=Bacillus massiliglaciei TaxID=1816693 RepID=UPI000DA6275A|nr:aspartyl-phosphate phosphatase Spo0E family protein [Bacillus massiliglaciei]